MVPGKVLLEVILGKQLFVQRVLERCHLIGLGRGGEARGVDARGLRSLLDFNVGVVMLVVVVGILGLWVRGWDGEGGMEMGLSMSDEGCVSGRQQKVVAGWDGGFKWMGGCGGTRRVGVK